MITLFVGYVEYLVILGRFLVLGVYSSVSHQCDIFAHS